MTIRMDARRGGPSTIAGGTHLYRVHVTICTGEAGSLLGSRSVETSHAVTFFVGDLNGARIRSLTRQLDIEPVVGQRGTQHVHPA